MQATTDPLTQGAHHLVLQAALQLAPFPDLAQPRHSLHWHNIQALALPLTAKLTLESEQLSFAQLQTAAMHAGTLAEFLLAQRTALGKDTAATLTTVTQAQDVYQNALLPLLGTKSVRSQVQLLSADINIRSYATCVPSNPHILSNASEQAAYTSIGQRIELVASLVRLLQACIQVNRYVLHLFLPLPLCCRLLCLRS